MLRWQSWATGARRRAMTRGGGGRPTACGPRRGASTGQNRRRGRRSRCRAAWGPRRRSARTAR
eukprot:2003616-Alexandrium_andersonii.AAC.1